MPSEGHPFSTTLTDVTQRLRRAVHPDAEGETALGQDLSDGRGLRLALIEFRKAYNERWLIERHGHRSPAQFRRDQMDTLPLAA
jgi:hypothetical protein